MSKRVTVICVVMVVSFLLSSAHAQTQGTENGEWRYIGGDVWHTRYSPADQIDASNFEDLEVAWEWDASSFGSSTSRATPSYVGGKLITVTGNRRHVISLDPETGELLWSFTEPNTPRLSIPCGRVMERASPTLRSTAEGSSSSPAQHSSCTR